MNDYISKTAEWESQALAQVERHMHDDDPAEWRRWSTILTERSAFKHDVCDAPAADVVEVVRCRDCRWWDKIEGTQVGYCHACKHGYCSSNWEISINRTYRWDFYCADGERKDGDRDG